MPSFSKLLGFALLAVAAGSLRGGVKVDHSAEQMDHHHNGLLETQAMLSKPCKRGRGRRQTRNHNIGCSSGGRHRSAAAEKAAAEKAAAEKVAAEKAAAEKAAAEKAAAEKAAAKGKRSKGKRSKGKRSKGKRSKGKRSKGKKRL